MARTVQTLEGIGIGGIGIIQGIAEFVHVLKETEQLGMDAFGHPVDFGYVPFLQGLFPAHPYHLKEDQEVHLRDYQHTARTGVLPKEGIGGHHQLECRLDRHEHDIEIHQLLFLRKIRVVIFPRHFLDMRKHALHMLFCEPVPFGLPGGIHIAVERLEGDFRVDDHHRVVGIIYHHIRLEFPALPGLHRIAFGVADAALDIVMHSALHPGTVQQPVQQYLPEISLKLDLARDCIRKLRRLFFHGRGPLQHHFDRRPKLGVVLYAFEPCIVKALVEPP